MSAIIADEMNIAVPERADAATTRPTQPFLWSIRRELWENPSIIVAPIVVACFIVLATLFAAVRFTGPFVLKLEERKSSYIEHRSSAHPSGPHVSRRHDGARRHLLLTRRTSKRTPGPQHPILEISSRL